MRLPSRVSCHLFANDCISLCFLFCFVLFYAAQQSQLFLGKAAYHFPVWDPLRRTKCISLLLQMAPEELKKHLTQSYHVSTHIHTQNALLLRYSRHTPLFCMSVLKMGLSGLLNIIPKDRFTPSHSCVSSVTAQQAVNCRPLFVLFVGIGAITTT